ncbi:CocE/NonD family hydrolase, partial [Mesorhizobium sp.]
MKTVTEFPRKVVEFPDMGIVMPDGCRLSARIWMPEDAADNPVPAILEHLPYRKRDGTIFRDQLTHPYFAGHGYASIRVDMRGNGDSEGLMDDEYSEQELQDACDVIAWAAAQPWCNGNVGMMGISWGGFNCLQVAAKQPLALKAVISLCSTVDRYADDIHYKGGCLLLENFGWASTMLSYSSRPPDPAIAGGNRWRDLWLSRLENQAFLLPLWLSHQHRDAYWKRGSICEDFSAVKAAVLSIGGWHDGYRNTISNLVTGIQSPVKGIVGPWIHKYPHYAGPNPAIGFLQEALRWWDRWLKGAATGVEADPDYRAYVMDSVRPARWHPERPGRWVAEQEWPSSNIKVEAIELIANGGKPLIVASPQTCGLAGGEYFPFTFGPELPGDQRPDDALSVCFDQPELG